MKKHLSLLAALAAMPFGIVFAAAPEYQVTLVNAPVKIDGVLDEQAWAGVASIDKDLRFPWEKKTAPKTIFKSFHDEQNFYFSFAVTDANIVTEADWKGERTVDNEDRVELFFAPSAIDVKAGKKFPVYYAVEIDPMGRTHDYSMTFYRKDMNSDWNMPGLQAAAAAVKGGYIVEGMIPLASLKKLKLINNGALQTGVYRAEFSKAKNGDLAMRWISWVDPQTPEPDFHVNSSFGVFIFKGLK